MSYRLGVDVGGTFTDLLLVNENQVTFILQKYPVPRKIHRLEFLMVLLKSAQSPI